jgi:methyl-accepting chemotaxis protein
VEHQAAERRESSSFEPTKSWNLPGARPGAASPGLHRDGGERVGIEIQAEEPAGARLARDARHGEPVEESAPMSRNVSAVHPASLVHGPFFWGIKFFRRLRFRAKFAAIATVLIFPCVWLGVSYFRDNAQLVDFTAKEVVGVTYARSVLPALKAAQQERLDPTSNAFDAAFTALSAIDGSSGAALGTAASFARLQESVAAAAKQTQGEARASARSDLIDALFDTWGAATDGSNLTLDPDMDSYYVMDAATGQEPQIMELTERLRALGGAVLAAGNASPAQAHELAQNTTLLAFHVGALHADLEKASGATPALDDQLKRDDAIKAMQAFVDMARHDFLSEMAMQGDRGAFLVAADLAATGTWNLEGRSVDVLESLLKRRLHGLTKARNITIAAIALASLLGAYLFCSFYLATRNSLREVQQHLEAIAGGDLTLARAAEGRDEIADLVTTLNAMRASLLRIVGQVRRGAGEVATASSQIASGSGDLSYRSEEQAASLEQTSAAIAALASSAKTNALNSREANQGAVAASMAVSSGSDMVARVLAKMDGMAKSSAQVGAIVAVIEGIAFQTNILALNAAIEAARAGETGRGFAVVAAEVRSLSKRSADAANEIKRLAAQSVYQAQEGLELVGNAQAAMKDVVGTIAVATDLITRIAAASDEQSTSVTEISAAISQMDNMTQQNAALVEEAAAASASLDEQAHGLVAAMGIFRLIE